MDVIEHMLSSGRLALDLALYVMLPITVIMGSIMMVFDHRGVLKWLSDLLTPISNLFGASGLSLIALSKMLFVSSIAPLPTLNKLDIQERDNRKLAASLALVLTATQGNVSFPMIAYGLDFGVLLASSIIGGVLASAITYYLFAAKLSSDFQKNTPDCSAPISRPRKTVVQSLSEGGMEGMKIAVNMIPMLTVTLFLLAVLKELNAIQWLTECLSPAFSAIGLPSSAALPVITKYIAGGTAYMGVMIDLIEQGSMTVRDINIIAGLASNPVDLVGVAVFSAIGPRIGKIFRYAIMGAVIGLIARALIHIYWFS
ncbi:MAG: nucleoside recognition family protein [Marinomonas atlantica]|nr:nucleoside recognition family protein [Marinomonas atlantica]